MENVTNVENIMSSPNVRDQLLAKEGKSSLERYGYARWTYDAYIIGGELR
jgi:hypothetical protein